MVEHYSQISGNFKTQSRISGQIKDINEISGQLGPLGILLNARNM
jgi:hypothetical protein